MTIDPTTKRSLQTIIVTQCLGLLAAQLFLNGFMLTYLSRLGIPSYRIFFLLSLIPCGGLLLTVPFAYLSDRFEKKRVGICGLFIAVAGLILLICAGSASAATLTATAGILLFSIGNSAAGAGWFALLSPIVPPEIRGRFFGKLRIAWQSCGVVFTLVISALMNRFTQIRFYQYVLLFAVGTSLLRNQFYWKIPELETSRPAPGGLWAALAKTLQIPNYLPFCAYTFLLTLFTGSIALVVGMLSKDVLLFSGAQILMVGNCAAVGAIAGFYIGGKMVDHIGTRIVFLICHVGFAVILVLIALRGFSPFPALTTICLLSGLFGALGGASGIAFTSELLAIIPLKNKSLSTGFHLSLINAGAALSSLLIGQALKLNIFSPSWTFLNQTLSAYDSILLGSAAMTLLLLIVIGLIPSILQVRKAQWFPQNR